MKYVILMGCVLYSLAAYSQNNKIVSDSAKKKELLLALKSVALCNCLINGFPKDSLRSKDQSFFLLLDRYEINYGFVDTVTLLCDKFTAPYKKTYGQEGLHKPRVMIGCIDFYKSQELDLLVRKYVRLHQREFVHW